MASQPSSIQDEERKRLRLRAWEQRNQETSQSKEFNSEKFPVFGEPYKVYKEDELSTRIRRMLGSYEDVKSPRPFSAEGLPIPADVTFSQSDHSPPNFDKSTKAPFHNQVLHSSTTESQTGPLTTSCSTQPSKMSNGSSSPKHNGQSSTYSTPSLNHGQSSELGHSAHQLKKSEVHSDLMEMSSASPDAKLPPPSHSSDLKTTGTPTTDTLDRQQLQRSTDHPAQTVNVADISTPNVKQSPKDAVASQTNKTGPLPSQTFPPLLSSKQPCTVMTQKPTAYVRPMDGQDQVVSESPALKPSPEPYVPVAELINKSDPDKDHTKPQSLETSTDEAQCVEDVLREMTHSWPPVLTALHTPNTQEPSKFLFPVEQGEHVSSCPGQKTHDSSSSISSNLKEQPSSNSFEAAHSSGRETGSSSDSDISSGSESDSERTAEEPVQPSNNSQPDTPALGHANWQLGNWIRSSQQSSVAEDHGGAHVSESPPHKQLLYTVRSVVEPIDPAETTKPAFSSHQTADLSIPRQHVENPQDKHCQNGRQKALSADANGCGGSRKLSKTTKASCPDHSVKSETVLSTQTKDSGFTDKPKVKTKAGPAKEVKERISIKINLKRTNSISLNGQKVASKGGPGAQLILPAHCPSCGVPYPNRCSCAARSQTPADGGARSKPRAEYICSKATAKPRKTTRKHLKQPGHAAKDGQDPSRNPPPPLPPLLVKIDLSLLSRVPQVPSSNHQGIASIAKTSAAVRERGGGVGDVSAKRKHAKTSKKHTMPNVDVEDSSVPRKKRKLENGNTSLTLSLKPKISNKPPEVKKKAKKTPQQQPATFKVKAADSKLWKICSVKTPESSGETVRNKNSRKQKTNGSVKLQEPSHSEKQKPPKRSLPAQMPSQPIRHGLTNRPLLRPEERRYPVKHYIKEAKRLKHKADAEPDKLSKAFNYLDAAMFFVESGIAMEMDPQISMSSYTMFAETVELLKFVLKLKNSMESSSSPPEKDFLALCLKCQALLQMALFRHKYKTALKYSKMLTDHFNTSAQATNNPPKVADHPSPSTPSPAGTPARHAGTAALIPQAMEQVTFSYVGITTLVLSSHDLWEQAEELAQGGSGLLSELDTVLGPLSLSSGMSSMVHYTRQGVHWLRLDSHKG
ncbi:unnamed protein product [Ophioblennius macclurei]